MIKNMMDALICPETQSALNVFPVKTAKNGDSEEIIIGLLQSKTDAGFIYPIINGIPRMLPNSLSEHISAILAYRDQIPSSVMEEIEKKPHIVNAPDAAYSHARKSFSSEWEKLETGRAWGMSREFRKQHFLKCLKIREHDLIGKRVLDAGCGNGDVEVSLINAGADLYSLDISDSVDFVRERIIAESPELVKKICIVQGNVSKPPFLKGSFDYVFSSGVLHHTPNTRESFISISQTVKKGGRCSILVYSLDGKNILDKIYYYMTELIRFFTTRMPHRLLHLFCYIGAIFFWLFVKIVCILTKQNRYSGRDRTLKEYELSLFDTYSPLYDHHHSASEVTGWFESQNFTGTEVIYTDHILVCVVGIN